MSISRNSPSSPRREREFGGGREFGVVFQNAEGSGNSRRSGVATIPPRDRSPPAKPACRDASAILSDPIRGGAPPLASIHRWKEGREGRIDD